MNLYVGNLSFNVEESELETAFSAYGEVSSVKVIKDRETGRSRGFAFVEMRDRSAAEAAMEGLNLKEFDGRAITVNEARPKPTTNRW